MLQQKYFPSITDSVKNNNSGGWFLEADVSALNTVDDFLLKYYMPKTAITMYRNVYIIYICYTYIHACRVKFSNVWGKSLVSTPAYWTIGVAVGMREIILVA